jgi:hypothetical protein
MLKKIIVFLLIFLAVHIQPLNAQTLEQELSKILQLDKSEEYLKNYLSPFSEALGTNMATAVFYRAKFPHFNIGLNFTSALIPKKSKNFISPSNEEQPTIFGSKSADEISGFDLDKLVLPVCQLNIGFFANFEFSLRYTNWELNDIGTIKMVGGGIKYELVDMSPISGFPVDMSIITLYHSLQVDDYMQAGAFGMNFNLSKKIPAAPIEIFAGISYNNSELSIDTEKINKDNSIGKVTISGLNELRYHTGLGIEIYFLNLHFDYNFGLYNSISAGIMLEL